MKKILLLPWVLLACPLAIFGQEVDSLWQEYIRLESQLQNTIRQESTCLDRQRALLEKQHRLKAKQSWLNGWIVEMRLSGVSKSLVAVADSLEVYRERKTSLTYRRNYVLNEFKHAYRELLSQRRGVVDTTDVQSGRAVVLARSLITMETPGDMLPDYAGILEVLYDSEQTKELVLGDLRSVLEHKLVLIDSLLRERQMDLALLNRLAEFHKDLQVQMESNIDYGSGAGMQSQPLADGDNSFSDAPGNDFAHPGYSNWTEPGFDESATRAGQSGSGEPAADASTLRTNTEDQIGTG
ncbi:MAG TPA: hypothetical protein VKA68_08965, partial [bacterium]|nr:hypothetical protein [bacterium]